MANSVRVAIETLITLVTADIKSVTQRFKNTPMIHGLLTGGDAMSYCLVATLPASSSSDRSKLLFEVAGAEWSGSGKRVDKYLVTVRDGINVVWQSSGSAYTPFEAETYLQADGTTRVYVLAVATYLAGTLSGYMLTNTGSEVQPVTPAAFAIGTPAGTLTWSTRTSQPAPLNLPSLADGLLRLRAGTDNFNTLGWRDLLSGVSVNGPLLSGSGGGGGAVNNAVDGYRLIWSWANFGMQVFGSLVLNKPTVPVTVGADAGALWASSSAGRVVPAWKTSSENRDLQDALWGNVDIVSPNGATYTQLGVGTTSVGAATGALASTSYRNSQQRITHTTATTAGAAAGVRMASNNRVRGSAAGAGGFYVVLRFSLTLQAGHQAFVGLLPTAALAGEPSALLDMIGIGADAADANLFIMSNDNAGVATKTPLTSALAKTSTDVLRLTLHAGANAASIGVNVFNETTGTVLYNGVIAADLPRNTVFLSPVLQARNGATTTAAVVDVLRIYSSAPAQGVF